MLCPSPLWRSAPRGHRCKARLGGDAVGLAGEPSNTRRPRGPRRKEAEGGRGVGRSTPPPVVAAARAEGGAPLTAGLREARLSVAGRSATRGRGLCSCRRPQVRAPLSPRCVRGERFSFSPGVGPPSPLTLRICSIVARELGS
ncbi:hypothetical protein NDU88_004719 [Pleurodeles waltl]|uniref:Uncharacterized protein n=1 Tax=Pleurodeles waltl TaxID=8319 RepID=A0AAV7LM62_PLEWA|nr:hypothetical protein NDU88_004719 [Pleurodeles waltl]